MKILYITTISNTINAFLVPHIKLLLTLGHHVDIACRLVRDINPYLIEQGCNVFNIDFQRSPLSFKNYTAYKELKKLIKEGQYDLVHCHTPVASACARIACRKMKNVKVVYTAHGFHFFKGAPIKNWLLFYPVEWWLSKYTDVLITINKEDYWRAEQSFKAGRVEYIPGAGLDTTRFFNTVADRDKKRNELNIPSNALVVLSVGELNKNKNHETIIKAIAKLNNPNIYYVICGQGSLEEYLKSLPIKLGIDNQVKLLGFRNDLNELYKSSDIFALPSRREGLGLSALEAMSCGLPIITSNIHGIVDYSINGVTGFNCAPDDIEGFAHGIAHLASDEGLRVKMGTNNIEVTKQFDSRIVTMMMSRIYRQEQ